MNRSNQFNQKTNGLIYVLHNKRKIYVQHNKHKQNKVIYSDEWQPLNRRLSTRDRQPQNVPELSMYSSALLSNLPEPCPAVYQQNMGKISWMTQSKNKTIIVKTTNSESQWNSTHSIKCNANSKLITIN